VYGLRVSAATSGAISAWIRAFSASRPIDSVNASTSQVWST
jgi:hypothetical protein